MIAITDVQWPAFFCGALGSYLVGSVGAHSTRKRQLGFSWFLGSNCCWITYGLATGGVALVLQQLVFTVTSILGVIRNHRESKNPLPLLMDAVRQLKRSELEALAKHIHELIPNAVHV